MSDIALFPLLVLALVALIILSTGGIACVMALKMGGQPTDQQRQAFDAMLGIFVAGAGAVIAALARITGPRVGAGRQGGHFPGRIGKGRQRPPVRGLDGPKADDRPDDPC